jgi:predicted nucleotidyltransferase
MVCYPEVQKEAQAELDKVLNGRLPEPNDIASLPYLSAVIKEVYRYAAVCLKHLSFHAKPASITSSRWQPILPLGRPAFFFSYIITRW